MDLEAARAILAATFGYPDFRGGQADAVAGVLAGRDVLVLMPTGGGKSLCYQVPGLALGGLTLVVSPLISLMKDQVDALARRGVAAAALHSGLPPGESSRVLRDAATALAFLYVAPERFDAPAFRERLGDLPVRLLAIDEAHCISQWGYDFRPAYLRLGAVRDRLRCPVIALTATATPAVRADIERRLRLQDPVVVTKGFDRTNLAWHVVAADGDRLARLHALLRARRGGSAVVYASTRRAVDGVADALNRMGLRAAGYHAGIRPDQRIVLQESFIDGRVPVIVATNAFGMGIDKPDVRIVAHVAMASNLEGYYQEAGRAGRDGAPADCVLLHGPEDRRTHDFLIDQAHPPRRVIESVFAALAALPLGRETMVAPGDLAAAAGCLPRQVESALRVLESGGLARVHGPEPVRPQIRFAVPPDRLVRCLRAQGRGPEGSLVSRLARPGSGWIPVALPRDDLVLLAGLHDEGWLELRRTTGRFRLERIRAAPAARLPLDWTLVQARRRREIARLDAMEGYALTRGCRRAWVLRYFGDEPPARCDGCDRCTGVTLLPDARPPRRTIAATARRVHRLLTEHLT